MTKINTAVQISERMAAVVSGSTRQAQGHAHGQNHSLPDGGNEAGRSYGRQSVKHVNNGLHRLALLPYIVRGFCDCTFDQLQFFFGQLTVSQERKQ